MAKSDGQRYLDRWAVDTGYADFDTYLRLGGTLAFCRADLRRQREMMNQALDYLYTQRFDPPRPAPEPLVPREPVVGPEALARLEAEQHGEAGDALNAHPQGSDG